MDNENPLSSWPHTPWYMAEVWQEHLDATGQGWGVMDASLYALQIVACTGSMDSASSMDQIDKFDCRAPILALSSNVDMRMMSVQICPHCDGSGNGSLTTCSIALRAGRRGWVAGYIWDRRHHIRGDPHLPVPHAVLAGARHGMQWQGELAIRGDPHLPVPHVNMGWTLFKTTCTFLVHEKYFCITQWTFFITWLILSIIQYYFLRSKLRNFSTT